MTQNKNIKDCFPFLKGWPTLWCNLSFSTLARISLTLAFSSNYILSLHLLLFHPAYITPVFLRVLRQ